jgi:hypothetical protein
VATWNELLQRNRTVTVHDPVIAHTYALSDDNAQVALVYVWVVSHTGFRVFVAPSSERPDGKNAIAFSYDVEDQLLPMHLAHWRQFFTGSTGDLHMSDPFPEALLK